MATIAPMAIDEGDKEPAEAIDLRSLGAIFRRRLRTFLVIAVLVTVLVAAVLVLLPNRYTATVGVLLNRQKADVTEVSSVLSDLPSDSASVDTEVQVLRSPSLLRSVVERMKLQNDPEFNETLAPSFLSSAMGSIRQLFGPPDKDNKADPLAREIANLTSDIDISRNGLTYVIGVSVTTKDGTKSADIANAISEEYIGRQISAKRQAAIDAQDFLRSRLSGLGGEVQSKEAAAQNLRARVGLPEAENQTTYDQQVIQDSSRQLSELQSDLAEKEGKLAVAEGARSNPSALPAVIESNVIRDLKSKRTEALAAMTDVSARYGPLHPETRKAQDNLRELDREISGEMSSIVSSLRQEVTAARSRVGAVSGRLNQQRGASVANSGSAAAVQQLDREALASRGVYEDFLKRSKETTATEDLVRPDALIVSKATAPFKPSAPNRPLLLLAGLIAAIGLGCIGIIAAELIDIKISSGADIERYLGLSRLVSVPDLAPPAGTDSHALLITQRPMSSYAEAYRELSNLVTQRAVEGNGHVVMISSAVPHEGKTSVACSLALSLAAASHRVLIIDADLRRPQVLAALQVGNPTHVIPMREIVSGKTPLAQGMVKFPDLSLDVLPLAAEKADLEIFRGDDFAPFLVRLRGLYDYIIVDTPPILALSDGRNLAPLSDEVMLVTRWRKTSRYAAKAANFALSQSHAPVSGVVLNAVNLKAQSLYARDDSLAFYNDYRAYYTD